MLTLKHFLVTEATPFEDSMYIEVGISHEIISEHNGVIKVETTVLLFDVETDSTDSMNLIH
jgi:hypothetical protein